MTLLLTMGDLGLKFHVRADASTSVGVRDKRHPPNLGCDLDLDVTRRDVDDRRSWSCAVSSDIGGRNASVLSRVTLVVEML